jgi:hypothetical protein
MATAAAKKKLTISNKIEMKINITPTNHSFSTTPILILNLSKSSGKLTPRQSAIRQQFLVLASGTVAQASLGALSRLVSG